MKLYHGGLVKVEKPEILVPTMNRTNDFGVGFYTTRSRDQAVQWTRIRMARDGIESGILSQFEADDDLFTKDRLKILVFSSPTREWLHFVMANRLATATYHDYDLVAGPVANDRVYTTLTLFESSLINEEETLNRLKTFVLVDQILFHTEKSLNEIRFTGWEEIR